MKPAIYIGTSGWHYDHWLGIFYPADVTGYNELRFHAGHFNTVENNSSFYRIASEGTYKTWSRMTPEGYRFSMKLNKLITHANRLELTDEAQERIRHILGTTQVLGGKIGAMLVQLPPSFPYDLDRLGRFLAFFCLEARAKEHPFDIAIEFRHARWFTDETYALLRKHNVALVASQSSRYPEMRQVTSDIAYIRMHGPTKLFASKYTDEQLEEWAAYIKKIGSKVKRVYVYFNNDFHGYALEDAKALMELCGVQPVASVA